ncbi:MAG: PD-(D/E)XK nuclease family protein [bacterium]
MSEYNYVLDLIGDASQEIKEELITKNNDNNFKEVIPDTRPDSIKLFDLSCFGRELHTNSQLKNKSYQEYAQNISAYDLGVNCIRTVLYKLTKTPVKSYADKWLPLAMRSIIGSSIHGFIQTNSNQFTEQEVSLKIPSIRFSGRLDCLVNNNVLVEIKSVTYKDYKKIIKKQTPRDDDFYQALVYKYMLENHIQEAKDPNIKIRKGTSKPMLDFYDIKYIQFVYVAHEIMAADVEDLSEALHVMQQTKTMLNSAKNKFYFVTQLAVDATKCEQHINYLKTKLDHILYYLNNNKIPPKEDPFIDSKKCFFCQYNNVCDVKGKK